MPSPDTRIVYVSSSGGTDWSDDIVYRADDPEIGGDPFHPVGEPLAYRTISAAVDRLRDGEPDWILLRKGDAWEVGFSDPRWTLSGAGPLEPMVIGGWGEGARPVVPDVITRYGPNDPDAAFDHVAIVGLHFTDGIERLVGGRGFLIEDCYFDECAAAIQGLGPIDDRTYLFDVAIRRCVLFGNYATDSHAQNLFVARTDGLLVEECVLDRGGWHPDIAGAEPTIFNHNAYIQNTTTNVVFRGNISARASSHGVQMRRGGLCEDNLFLQNPVSILFGSTENEWPAIVGSGVIRENVILDSRDIDQHPRGHGVWMERVDDVEAYGNIIAHQRSGSVGVAFNLGQEYRDVTLRDNVVYNWTKPGDLRAGLGVKVDGEPFGENTIAANLIQQPRGGRMIEHRDSFDTFTYADGAYFSSNEPDEWFQPGGTVDGWIDASGETGARAGRAPFVNPDRTIESYMASLGRIASLEAFLAETRRQSKDFWRPEFTAHAVNQWIRDGFSAPATGELAELVDHEIVVGERLEGGLADLTESDDRRLEILADIQGPAVPFAVALRIDAQSPDAAATQGHLRIESSLDQPAGVSRVFIYNWRREDFDLIRVHPVTPNDRTELISVDAADRIRPGDGRIRLLVYHSAIAFFDHGAFRSAFDHVEVRVD